ncbi:hypothetical protein AURDEDRAFT_148505 [Auricularia subglabra TFB-10046 SS5]|nr:hypothetical protein AURDEDRAFT_148505 [Auricularia subglabra TFB-10046 SS5]
MESSKWDAVRNGGGVARVRPDVPVVHAADVSTWPWPWLVASAFAVLWALRWAQVRFLEWRARTLRRETRRRYGIPDTDDRPFHIAYNAAAAAKRQRELAELAKKREEENASMPQYPDPTSAPPPSVLDGALRRRQLSQQPAVAHQPVHFNSQPIIDTRAPYGALRRPNVQHAPSYPSTHYQQQQQQQQHEPDWTHRYNPNPPPAQAAQAPRIVSTRKGVARLDFGSNFVERRKHVLGGVPFPVEPSSRKGKRQQSDNDADDDAGYRKRARKHDGLEDDRDAEMGDAEDEGESTDAMETDALPAHNASRVSLKRHRSDAASVVGAEDEQPRSRKLRKKGADKGSAPVSKTARGTKRDRLAEEDEDDELPARYKRGRSESSTSSFEDEEMAEEEEVQEVQVPEIEVEPSCGDRNVGDEWSEGDVQYKVGPEGQRLRLAHLKQFRTRPVKAKDFATNKPPVQVPVVVEHWLNDAEFERAKEKKELAWGYDTDEEGSLPEAPAEDTAAKQVARVLAEPSPSSSRASAGGKVLLWDTPSRSARTTPGSTPGLSPASDALANPFARTNGASLGTRGKRIATGGSTVERPDQLRYSRSFSKWEKQEAEAEALAALRRKEKEKEEEERKKKAPPPAPVPSFAPTHAATSAPSSTGSATTSNPLLFKAPDAGAPKPAEAGKPAATSTEPPKFNLNFPTSTAAPKPATGDATSSAPKTGFSFGPLPGSTPSAGADVAKPPAAGGLSSGFNLPPNPLLSGTAPKTAVSTPSFMLSTPAPSAAPSFSFPTAGKDKDKEAPKFTGGDAPKPASGFSFGPLPGSTPAPAADAAKTPFSFSSATTAPAMTTPAPGGDPNKSLFGPPSSATKPPFGFPTPGSTPAATTAPGREPAKPAFNLFSASSTSSGGASGEPIKPASGAFSFPTPSTAPTTRGTEGSKSMFSLPSSAPAGATVTEASKSMFSFPTPSTAASTVPKPSLSFPTPVPASGASSFFSTPPAGTTPAVVASNPFAPPAGGSGVAAAAAAPALNALGRPMRAMRGGKSPGPTNALTPSAPGSTPAAPAGSAFSFGNTSAPGAATTAGSTASPFGSFTTPAAALTPAASGSGSGFNLFGGATGAGTGANPAAAPASSGFSFGTPSSVPAAGAAGPPALFGSAPSTTASLFGGAAAPGTPGAQGAQSNTPFGTPSTSTGFTFGSQNLGVASSSRPSTADSQRTVVKSPPRMTRYRYVAQSRQVNELPPALPPPTGDLPPTPPQSQSAFTRFTSQPVPYTPTAYTPTSATTSTGSVPFSPASPESQPATPPPRPPRSSSRPAPASRSATPTPAMLDIPEPKQMRRRSRSLGSLPAPPPPYDSIVNPRFHRGDPPAAVTGRGRSGTDASAPLSRADLLSAMAEGRAPSPMALAARSDSPMTLAGDADTLRHRGLRTLRRMSKSLTQLRSRSKSTERGAASSLFRPLVTVIPPMPDKVPPFPDDRPSIDSTTTLNAASSSSRVVATQDDSSLGRAPPVMLSNTLETEQVANNPPRPAPKPPSAFKGDPSLGKAPLAARDDSAVREQIVTHGLKRVSRSRRLRRSVLFSYRMTQAPSSCALGLQIRLLAPLLPNPWRL